jgi:hypothetical protein
VTAITKEPCDPQLASSCDRREQVPEFAISS